MARAAYIVIDGKRHLWRDIPELRKQQLRERRPAEQPALFELIDDSRPPWRSAFLERLCAGRRKSSALCERI
jgi:hypothetical protein